MAYTEAEARNLVILSARRLVDAGLTARTWGNLSARISDEQFVITPSGLGYDIMEPEDLVIVNISDLSYEGNRKPSSEKGIHADAYRLRPEVNFVIHTHQFRHPHPPRQGFRLRHPRLGSERPYGFHPGKTGPLRGLRPSRHGKASPGSG